MRHIVFCGALLISTISFGQQGQPPPTTTPPYQTPPTFPEGRQTPREQIPPDTRAPEATSNQQVEGQILNQLKADSKLAATNVDAKVDSNSVVLTGNVDTRMQRGHAVRIAQHYAGSRKIVDKIKIKQKT